MRHVHVITPGDHFSPSTGSAVPTVVNGLCYGLPPGEIRPAVVVARGTYADRYPSAEAIEYVEAPRLAAPVQRVAKLIDGAGSRTIARRPMTERSWRATLAGQRAWPASIVMGHNAPQMPRLVDANRHRPVLYAHNHVLRSYTKLEVGRVLDKVSTIVAVSDALAAQLSDHLPSRMHSRVVVVRNGVDVGFFRRPKPIGPRQGPLQVTFLGRMIWEKGPDVLVDAVARMRQREVVVTLVGSSGFSETDPLTPFEERLHREAAGVSDRVHLSPFVPRFEVRDLLHQTDVLVVPSRWPDPFALTVLEGMAAGAVVIGSHIGGIPEAMGPAGLSVPPDDPAALADALDSLVEDDTNRRMLATAGVEYAMTRDWSVVSAELVSALEQRT